MLDRKAMCDELRQVIKRLHCPLEVMLAYVLRYAAYPLSLCATIEEMMAERGVTVSHATVVHVGRWALGAGRWALKILLVMAKVFRWRQHPIGKFWGDRTYVLVSGHWKYLYRAVDKAGKTADFLLTVRRDEASARQFVERAMNLHDVPAKITIDKRGANTAAVRGPIADSDVAIKRRQLKYLTTWSSKTSARSRDGPEQ